MKLRQQTLEEEYANTFTHGIGIVFTLVAIPYLLEKASNSGHNGAYFATLLFGFGLLSVYVCSTLYHGIQTQPAKRWFHICDHVAIFFLIGGSYMPFVQRYVDAPMSTVFLSCQWAMILAGAILKLFFTGKYHKASLFVYIFLGWSAVFLVYPFMAKMHFEVFQWILIGGLSYTTGVFFYRWETQKYAHTIWHLFVLGGSVAHFWAAYRMYQLS